MEPGCITTIEHLLRRTLLRSVRYAASCSCVMICCTSVRRNQRRTKHCCRVQNLLLLCYGCIYSIDNGNLCTLQLLLPVVLCQHFIKACKQQFNRTVIDLAQKIFIECFICPYRVGQSLEYGTYIKCIYPFFKTAATRWFLENDRIVTVRKIVLAKDLYKRIDELLECELATVYRFCLQCKRVIT